MCFPVTIGAGGGAAAISKAAAAISLEGLKLDNDIKRTQIASMARNLTQPGTPPPYSIDGPTLKLQTNRDLSDRTPFSVPGSGPDVVMTDTNRGNLTWDTPPQLAESRESDPWYKNAIGFYRNGIYPYMSPHSSVPQSVIDRLPPGTVPLFNPFMQEWTAVRAGSTNYRGTGRHLGISYGYRRY